MFEYIGNHVDPEVIIWGGNTNPHNFNSQNENEQKQTLEIARSLFNKYFKCNRAVYTMLGNDDYYPINEYSGKYDKYF